MKKKLKKAIILSSAVLLWGSYVPLLNATENKADATNQTQPQIKVQGVIAEKNGEPITGAVIKLKDSTTNGTISDIDGKFTLEVPANGILQISFVGYKSTELSINGKSEFNIVLQEDTKLLDEIVVVGYGIQKKGSVTGSISAMQGEMLKEVVAPNISSMLVGRLPGLRGTQRSGKPGDADTDIDIRGYGAMLVIVDGVERYFNQIDPNDIESVSILKDAAAAVYGFKGSNGVLLITTKKGKAETAPKINYNGYLGFQQATRYPKLMNAYDYATLYNEGVMNIDPHNGKAVYSDEQLESFRDGSVGTDWWDETMRSAAPQTSHSLSVSGGSKSTQYYLSLAYLDQEGLLRSKDWNYNRYNVRSNITVEVTKGLKVDLQLRGMKDRRVNPYDAGELFQQAQMANPTFPVYANNNPEYWQANGDRPNPVHMSYKDEAGYDNRDRHEFNSSLSFTWELPWVDGLQAKAMFAYDYKNDEEKKWKKEAYEYSYNSVNDVYEKKTISSLSTLNSKMVNWHKPTQQYSFNYNKTFAGKHDVGGLLLWEMYYDKQKWLEGNKQYNIGLIDELEFGDKTNQRTGGNTGSSAHAGLVGRFNYAFDNRYLVEFSFRHDGSSKFRSGDRWGFFPGVSLGWRVSEESFFKNRLPDMDNLKIRASYAKVGDEGDFSAFQYLEGYRYDGHYVLGNNGVTLGLVNKGMANPWLTWYESKIKNIGFEASFKKGLITIEFDYFQRNRDGLKATRTGSLPTTFGENMPEENLNSDKNRGFEISLGHNHKFGDFKYNLSANFSSVRIYDDYVEREVSSNMYRNWRDNPNGRYKSIRWGKKTIGQFQSYEEIINSPIQDKNGNKSLMPGDLKFEDWNGDGIIDDKDVQPIGHGSSPRMYYGINMGAEYKGFDMTLFFQGASGHDIYINNDILDPFIQQGLGNGFEIMTDRWHREDPTDPYSKWIAGEMPAIRPSGFSDNRTENSWSLHKANYLRLKTLEIGYTLPDAVTKGVGIDKLRFYANFNNLLTFSSRNGFMKGVDPESDQNQLRYYPQLKTYNFGVNLTF